MAETADAPRPVDEASDTAPPARLRVRVLVLEDRASIAESLRRLIDEWDDLDIVGESDPNLPGAGSATIRAGSGASDGDRTTGDALSPREHDVLAVMAQGCSDREIAERLFISHNTARKHVQNVIRKLGVHSKLEAVVVAVRDGIVRPI